MIFVVHATESEALATCARIDAHLGYPRMDLDQLGREVPTGRYALPIELADGRFVVPITDEIAAPLRMPTAAVDVRAMRKVIPETAEPSARVRAYLDATRTPPKGKGSK